MVIQGHSRSRVLRSIESLPGTPYRYVIMLAFSLNFPMIQPAKTLKIAVADNTTAFDAPLQGTPANIRINLILPETKVIGLHFRR